jgi:hypothetical protein
MRLSKPLGSDPRFAQLVAYAKEKAKAASRSKEHELAHSAQSADPDANGFQRPPQHRVCRNRGVCAGRVLMAQSLDKVGTEDRRRQIPFNMIYD